MSHAQFTGASASGQGADGDGVEERLQALGPARGPEEDWGWLLAPARSVYCPFQLAMFNTVTGSTVAFRKPCGSWTCERCAPERAMQTLLGLWPHFRRAGRVYWHRFAWSDQALARIRQRARRQGADYAWVRRHPMMRDPRAHLFASRPLTGRKEPTTAVELAPYPALLVARQALAIPGVVRTDQSHGWSVTAGQLPLATPWHTFGPLSPTTWAVACEIVGEESQRRWGVRIEPDRELPAGVSVQEAHALWIRAIARARQQLQGSSGAP